MMQLIDRNHEENNKDFYERYILCQFHFIEKFLKFFF